MHKYPQLCHMQITLYTCISTYRSTLPLFSPAALVLHFMCLVSFPEELWELRRLDVVVIARCRPAYSAPLDCASVVTTILIVMFCSDIQG